MTLLIILVPIALLDSVSMVPLCLVPLAVILGGKKPVIGAVGLLTGIVLVYVLGGLALLFGLDALMDRFRPAVSRWWNEPNALELMIQLVLGLVMLFYARKQGTTQPKPGERSPSGEIGPGRAFALGAGLTLAGIPGALPYFGAIDQILRYDLTIAGNVVAVISYSLIFVLPQVCLILVRVLTPAHSDRLFGYISAVFEKHGPRGVIAVLIVIGVVLVLDAIGWFLGYPLLPTG